MDMYPRRLRDGGRNEGTERTGPLFPAGHDARAHVSIAARHNDSAGASRDGRLTARLQPLRRGSHMRSGGLSMRGITCRWACPSGGDPRARAGAGPGRAARGCWVVARQRARRMSCAAVGAGGGNTRNLSCSPLFFYSPVAAGLPRHRSRGSSSERPCAPGAEVENRRAWLLGGPRNATRDW